ncbi:MAG TPA: plasmid pRiA4b ORF-3 family protein, partial [Ktedonobacterales bacterium]|nr:plasmid pRiA4b ORF-3 family protein [Ktedonobacterales bacterium]
SYRYDFGDDWRHAIRVEKILPPEPGAQYPRCLTGKRSGPPEDCGGIWGYAELIETLQNPEREDYEEMREWVGDDFDPEAFSVETINAALRQLR